MEIGPFPEPMTQKFTYQVLEGLQYLHNLTPPVIHRDIKGDNILCETNGNIKLADFGSAKQKFMVIL